MESREKTDGEFVPLATLIRREINNQKIEKPTMVKHGYASQSRKGEDYFFVKTDCLRVHGNASTSFTAFGIFDGHNGNTAAIFSRDHLLNYVIDSIPRGLGRDEWIQALPRALVAGFVKTDKEFQSKDIGKTSGTTATFVIIDGYTVTVASVGDSRCILDARGGGVSILTVDHREEENAEERERVASSGAEIGRVRVCDTEVGPLRCWPGGLSLSRSIGDRDVGQFIVPVPYVKQVKLLNNGGRLIIASDGIWDSLSSEAAAQSCRGLPAEIAAKQLVKEAVKTRGLKDDTTCIVVDIIPYGNDNNSTLQHSPSIKKLNKLKALFLNNIFCGSGDDNNSHKSSKKLSAVSTVEGLFEQGSAMLEERLGGDDISGQTSDVIACALCRRDFAANEGMSVHAGSMFSTSSRPWQWQGPFLCEDCNNKKDHAMEGKRTSGVTVA